MLLVTKQSLDEAPRHEWPTLFFFLGLFVMVGAWRRRGRWARWQMA